MNKEEFKTKVESLQSVPHYKEPLGFGVCYADVGVMSGKVLQATYPVLNWGENFGAYAIL